MEIKQIDNSNFEDFFAFQNIAYPSRIEAEERFRFQFLKNYLLLDKSHPLILVAYDTDYLGKKKIVAQYASNPFEYCFNGITKPCFCGCDLYVVEDKRKYGLGGLLSLKAIKSYKPHISIGVSNEAKPLLESLNMGKIGEVHIFLWINKILSIPKYLFHQLSDAKIDLAVDEKLLYPEIEYSDKFKNITSLESWSSDLNKENVFKFSRDISFLKWRFFTRPGYYFYLGEKLTYFVLKKINLRGLNILAILDYHCNLNDKDTFTAILDITKKIAKKNCCDVVLTMSSHAFFDSRLRKKFFLKVGAPFDIYVNIIELFSKEKIKQRETTYITMADSDLEFAFWPKNNR